MNQIFAQSHPQLPQFHRTNVVALLVALGLGMGNVDEKREETSVGTLFCKPVPKHSAALDDIKLGIVVNAHFTTLWVIPFSSSASILNFVQKVSGLFSFSFI